MIIENKLFFGSGNNQS